MADYTGISEEQAVSGQYRVKGLKMADPGSIRNPESLQSDRLIHESFPKQDIISPAYLGSKSMSPTKGEGDYEERLPSDFMSKNYFNRNQ